MIGNDVIDLALARRESNWKRPGFLEKLFTVSERQLILDATNSELMVWNLWSRKEAAYKIYNRETGIRSFMPLRFECIWENETIGKVICDNRLFFTRTIITQDCIETVASVDVMFFPHVQHLESRVDIQKAAGIPHWNHKPVSISHHGRFERIVVYNPSLDLSFKNSNAMV